MKMLDLAGKQFGAWKVSAFSHFDSHGASYWFVKCDCGTEATVRGSSLVDKQSISCRRCFIKRRSTINGEGKTNEYKSWISMKRRCLKPLDKKYHLYGGRGISICERWMKYENFLMDMGRKPEGTSLDRIDVNGNYEPGNCRWATDIMQCNNTRRNRRITFNGETHTIMEWSRISGVNRETLRYRINRGVPIGEALEYRTWSGGRKMSVTEKPCRVIGCDWKWTRARGLCSSHYAYFAMLVRVGVTTWEAIGDGSVSAPKRGPTKKRHRAYNWEGEKCHAT